MAFSKLVFVFILPILFFCSFSIKSVSPAKILSLAFVSSRSHKITYDPLLQALAARGHELTVVSPIPAKKVIPNVTEVLTFDVESLQDAMPNMFERKKEKKNINLFEMLPKLVQTCLDTLDLPQVKALTNSKFDLIFVPSQVNECALAFASTFNAPVILISPLSVPASVATYFGNPSPTSFVPNLLGGYTDTMTFYQRVVNLLVEVGWRGVYTFYFQSQMETAYRSKLGTHIASSTDLYKSASLILSNSHFSIATIRPFLPDIVEVGGMHCHEAGPLPKELEDFVASGDQGFILFSMGTLLKSSTMPEFNREMLVRVFGKLKQKVIWKWDTEEMEGLSNNVKLSNWVPQQDVLGHPKIKAFITHGGFGSTTEAVYHGVPIVGLPMFADQTLNMHKAQEAEYGIILDFNTFTEEELLDAITKVVTEPMYKQKAMDISTLFRDQLDHPLNRAVFWSEYVLRHNGAVHLRSAGRDLNFFQYHSVDVIATIVATILVCGWVLFKICSVIFRLLYGFTFGKLRGRVTCALANSTYHKTNPATSKKQN